MKTMLGVLVAAASVAGVWLVGQTTGAFSGSTSSSGNSFQAASSFGGCPASPTPVWLNGSEHGSTSTPDIWWTTMGGITDSTVAHTGSKSLRVPKNSSIGYNRRMINGSSQVLHFAIRLAALPTGDVTLFLFDSTIGTDLRLKYDASGQKLALQWGTETHVVASSSIAAGTWYSIDIKANASATPLTASWQIDGVNQPDASSSAAATGFGYLVFGSSISETSTYTGYYDDILYSKTMADYPIGDVRIQALRPSGAGSHLNPASFRNNDDTAIDANSWMRLDDDLFGGTDYVKQVAAGTSDYLEFGFQDATETCILAVQAYAGMGSLGSQGNTFKSSIFDGATERVIYSGGSPCGNCTLPKNAVVPAASAPWTQSAVNGLIARIGYGTAASPQPYWSALMLEYAVK